MGQKKSYYDKNNQCEKLSLLMYAAGYDLTTA